MPAKAPLPTTCSLPFHPLAGSQTSILMSEFGVGLSVAATRQNSPSRAYGLAAPALAIGMQSLKPLLVFAWMPSLVVGYFALDLRVINRWRQVPIRSWVE